MYSKFEHINNIRERIQYNYMRRRNSMVKFQPFKNEKVVITIRIDSEKLEMIDKLATKIDISRNEFINQCLDYAINNLDKDDKKDNKNEDNNIKTDKIM